MWLTTFTIICLVLCARDACTKEVQTANGKIRGQTVSVLGKDVDVFYGVPYAKPPVGNLRFAHPQPPDSWAPSVRDATTHPDSCIQNEYIYPPGEEFRNTIGNFSEDCLYVTVVSPSKNSENLSVMFWIHGGGFRFGSPITLVTEGHFLAAENNVIVVSVGYRVGVMGFAYISKDTIPGNMGMMDQLLAMKWTKANIRNFGGDPDKITIFGESAGSQAVGLHLLSPLSKDYFTRAILQSGSPVGPGGSTPKSVLKSRLDIYAKHLGCPTDDDVILMNCLRGLDARTVVDGQAILGELDAQFAPLVDGYFLPDEPEALLKAGKYKHTQIINGITKDEMTLFFGFYILLNVSIADLPDSYVPTDEVYDRYTRFLAFANAPFPGALTTFYRSLVDDVVTRYDAMVRIQSDFMFNCPAVKLGGFYLKTDPVYMYQFEHVSSVNAYPRWMGATHSYDIEYAFGFPLNNSYNYTQEEKDFSRIMMTYWTNFAKTGDPNFPSAVPKVWPQYQMAKQQYQVLDVRSKLTTKNYLRRHECAFINDILPMISPNPLYPTTQKPARPCSGQANNLLASCPALTALTTLCMCLK